MPEALWDAAVAVYHNTGRDEAMCQAWQWMQLQGLSWAPSDPACYVSIAHAVTAQGDPREGAPLYTHVLTEDGHILMLLLKSMLSLENGISRQRVDSHSGCVHSELLWLC